jgi:hypothetical protein
VGWVLCRRNGSEAARATTLALMFLATCMDTPATQEESARSWPGHADHAQCPSLQPAQVRPELAFELVPVDAVERRVER